MPRASDGRVLFLHHRLQRSNLFCVLRVAEKQWRTGVLFLVQVHVRHVRAHQHMAARWVQFEHLDAGERGPESLGELVEYYAC